MAISISLSLAGFFSAGAAILKLIAHWRKRTREEEAGTGRTHQHTHIQNKKTFRRHFLKHNIFIRIFFVGAFRLWMLWLLTFRSCVALPNKEHAQDTPTTHSYTSI